MEKNVLSKFWFFLLLTVMGCLPLLQCGKSSVKASQEDEFDVRFTLPGRIEAAPEGLVEFSVNDGKAPLQSDVFMMTGTDGISFNCVIESVSSDKFSVRLSKSAVSGSYQVFLKRGQRKKSCGTTTLSIVKSIDFTPDKTTTVWGVVTCDEKGVPGVVVSDGELVAKTDSRGIYQLPSAKKWNYVFISVPSGYEVPSKGVLPQFHAYLGADASSVERQDFELTYVGDQSKHKMLFLGDMHLANRNNDKSQFAVFAKDFNSYRKSHKSEKVYAMTLGDMTWDIYWYKNKYAFPEYLDEINGQVSGIQIFHTMGNHDNDGHAGWKTKGNYTYGSDEYWAKDLEASAPFRSIVGPTHIAMNIGKVHYMLLDNINYENTYSSDSPSKAYNDSKMGDRDYHGGFRPDVMEWVKKDLSYVDKSTPIVVGFHIPLCNATGSTLNGEFGTNYEQLRAFINLFKDYAEVEFVSGHTHVNRMRPIPGYGSNMYEHNIGSVCGIWWNTSRGSGSGNNSQNGPSGSLCLCSDGAPSGYMVYDVNGTNRSWHYKAIGFNKSNVAETKQFKTYDMNEVASYYTTSASAFVTAITTTGITNTSKTQGSAKIYASKASLGLEEAANTVWINVWGFEKGSFAGYNACSVKVIENGQTTDITTTVNDGKGTANPIEGYRDPLATVTYDVYRYNLSGEYSAASTSRSSANHIFKYVAKSANSTLTIVYTDRFGNTYRETMTRPKKFAQNGTPIYTLD